MFSQKDRVVSLKRNRAVELTLYRGYGPLMPLAHAHPRRGLSSTAKTSVVTLILAKRPRSECLRIFNSRQKSAVYRREARDLSYGNARFLVVLKKS